MVSFFISLLRLVKIIVLGIKNDGDLKFLFFFVNILLANSTIFYTQIEHRLLLLVF